MQEHAGERVAVREWVNAHLADGMPPFSFTYGGVPSSQWLSRWPSQDVFIGEDALAIERRRTWSDPQTGLQVNCSYRVLTGFPAVEWVVTFSNAGSADSPLIEGLQALDARFTRPDGGEFVLHRALGSSASRADFAPVDELLRPNTQVHLAPVGGRSSNTTALPFFNIEGVGEGVMVGIGWSGQWAATFARDEGRELRVCAGLERMHLRLYPGETIRSPRMLLLFWQGEDRLRGHQLLRRLILTYLAWTHGGRPLEPPLACNGGPQLFDESNLATEHNQLALAERYRQFGLETEIWWIDAGWFEGGWPNGVGNWFARRDGFPRGLRPVSDGLKALGMNLLLWFEPERVYRGTWLDREHPDWVLRLPDNPQGLLDLGNSAARRWLIDHVSQMIDREGIRIYRQDFNMDPLPYWRAADAAARQGMTEIRHIQGLYAFWDELLVRHPGLMIDNCASGGRRLDLETSMRSIPLWRTDYQYFEPNGYQCHTYGLSFYLPHSGTGSAVPEPYAFRSAMNSALVLGWNLYLPGFPVERARKLIAEFKRCRPFFSGDYYPLTPYSTADDVWMAYQFHRPDLDQGIVLAFRRPQSVVDSISVKLCGLESNGWYALVDAEGSMSPHLLGGALQAGLDLVIENAPGSLLLMYQRVGQP